MLSDSEIAKKSRDSIRENPLTVESLNRASSFSHKPFIMVTGATSPTNNASSSSFAATTIIKKLAPSPRDGPSPSNNNKWRTKQPLSPRNNSNNNHRDGEISPRNNGGGISSPRMALKISRHPSPLQPQCEKGKETSSTSTITTSACNNPITDVLPIERSRSPAVATASVVSSLYSGAPTIASTTPVSHVVSPRVSTALSTEPKTSLNVKTCNSMDAISAVQSPLPDITNDDDNNNVVEEFDVDNLVALSPSPPPLLAFPITSPKTPTGTRSKKMLVVDPKSGRKYDLKFDDHSLTDKELYVIHKCTDEQSRMVVLSPDSSCNKTPTAKNTSTKGNKNNSGYFWRSPPVSPTNNNTNFPILHFGDNDVPVETEEQATSLLLHYVDSLMNDATLDTASAITDVSYHGHPRSGAHGRSGGNSTLLRRCGATLGGLCLIDDESEVDVLSAILADEDAHLAEKAAVLSATTATEEKAEVDVEERDDVECIPSNYMLVNNIVGVDDDAEELVHAMLRTRTIRQRLSIDESGGSQQDDNKQQNPILRDLFSPMSIAGSPLDLFSPMSSALSTVMSGLAKTFSFVNVNDDSITLDGGTLHETPMSYPPTIRRVCMIVKPDEVKSCLRGGEGGNTDCVGLLGMKFHQCGTDFQAHVRFIQRGSKAEKMGVKVGDRVSFAVALSNMTSDPNSERLAERLMKRLETVGMRTSYRELYDIFLSKTTNSRPIGMVFRRDRTATSKAAQTSPRSPRTANASCISNEFDWSTNFLQCLSIKCREYEFEQKAPFGNVVDLNEVGSMGHKLVLFLPPPNVDCSVSNLEVSDYLNDMLDNLAIGYHCTTSSPMMSCIDSTCVSNDVSTKPHVDFLSNRLLCMLVEQAMGLVFVRREYDENNNVTGSGFAVVRNAEGSWSAPCFLSVLGSSVGDCMDESRPSADALMIIIRNTAMVVGLNSGNAVKFSVQKNERANLLARDATIVGNHKGRFLPLAINFFILVKANMELNHSAYAPLSTDNVEAKDILTGELTII